MEADLEKVIRCNYTHSGAHSIQQVLEGLGPAQLGDFTCSDTTRLASLVNDPGLVGVFKLKIYQTWCTEMKLHLFMLGADCVCVCVSV